MVSLQSWLRNFHHYGGFLESGFSVIPIPEVDAGDGAIIVEVFAKHRDGSEKKL